MQNALTIGRIYIIIYISKYNTTIQTVIFHKMRGSIKKFKKEKIMKKKIFLFVAIIATLMCFMAISSSAETVLKAQDNNAYGDLSFFDESISVGRTDRDNGFTPYKADGETYSRVVMGDGTTFYTFPSYYIMVKNAYESGNPLFQYDFTSLNTAMETATGKNPGWGITNVYRIELPETMTRLNGGVQSFDGFSSMIELYMPANSTTVSTDKSCLFRDCKNLEIFHNVDTFLFKKGCLTDAFKNCAKLTSLTLCYSPDVVATGVNSFCGCTSLVSVNFVEAFPNITNIGNSAFSGCNALKSISSTGQEYAFVLQNGITSIGEKAFENCKTFKYLSIPSGVTYIGTAAFHTCSALEFVDFNDNQNDIDFNNWGHFMNCTSLKAVSMPDNVDVIMNRIFSGCRNLEALYLPSATVTIESNGYGNDSAFSYCNNMYFVNEPFEVRDENGIFYGDKFKMPEKPEIYYFPSNLKNIFQRDTGVGFCQCYNLNSVMVFPTTLTQFWINDGVFYDCGAKGAKFTVVFLGDMTNLRLGMRENRAKGVSYVFANSNDVDLSCVNIIDTSPSYTPYFNGDEAIYFCKSGKKFVLYNLGGENDANQYTKDNTELVEGTNHIRNPKADSIITPATCIDNAIGATYCFCTAKISEGEIEGTVLGHDFVDDFDCVSDNECSRCDVVEKALYTEHTFVRSIVYKSFAENGVKNCDCTNEGCTKYDEKDAVAAPIFEANGYSVREDGKALLGGYTINTDALKAYNLYNNTKLTYGIVMSNASNVTFDNTNAYTGGKGVMVSENNENYTTIKYTISGFSNVASLVDLKLVITLYVIDGNGNMSFIQNETSLEEASATVGAEAVSVNAVTLRYIAEKTLTDDETINDSENAEYKAILEAIKSVSVAVVPTTDEQ